MPSRQLVPLPVRDAPAGRPVPPAPMRGLCRGRPLKRWRYIGLYGEEAMLCAATARVWPGPAQRFHAIWDRRGPLRERTSLRPIPMTLDDWALRFPGAELTLEPAGAPMEVVSAHGPGYIWTRKTPVRAAGTVEGRPVTLRGLIDDSAGYHARNTAWLWCAGAGVDAGGREIAWNVVRGLHDAPVGSERTVWVEGVPAELPAGAFAEDLSAVRWAGGEELRFAEEARRARSENLLLVASDYVQPFGTFEGTLPGGVRVARGWGVMERHSARW